ncbi:AAA family ATPase [Streptomyces mutabilis]|uniref:ATP-binding cassette domain-containing protein n=1 Tax=Streptomyces mutabilis TaxID=67332 RepID=UPI003A4C6059
MLVERFRSCERAQIPLRPEVTVLVGENNAGKSSVIDALRLLTDPLDGRRALGGLGQPPPHRALRCPQALPRLPHVLPRKTASGPQRQQAAHRRSPQRNQRLLSEHAGRISRRRQPLPSRVNAVAAVGVLRSVVRHRAVSPPRQTG